MFHRIVNATVTVPVAIAMCWGAAQAAADDGDPTIRRPQLVAAPAAPVLPLLARGARGNEIYAGDPTCIPITIDNGAGIQGGGSQECGDGQWISLAYPVLTGGATIESINIVHLGVTND